MSLLMFYEFTVNITAHTVQSIFQFTMCTAHFLYLYLLQSFISV